MTFLEAALEILRHEGKPLHYKELTEHALGKKLLTFVGRTPEVTMQTQLTAAVKKAPGNPFVRVKPGIFGLLRYPEVTAGRARGLRQGRRAGGAERQRRRPRRPSGGETAAAASAGQRARRRDGRRRAGGAGAGDAAAGGGRRGRGEDDGGPGAAAGSGGARRAGRAGDGRGAAGEDTDTDADEPLHAPGFRPRRAPRHWLRPVFSKATDETTGG